MLSTDIRQESMVKRIEDIVSILMSEEPLFKEDLDYAETVQDLVTRIQKNLSFEEFNVMSDDTLKEYADSLMSVDILGKIGETFTPKQMVIFEDAIKRK